MLLERMLEAAEDEALLVKMEDLYQRNHSISLLSTVDSVEIALLGGVSAILDVL